MKPYFDKKPKEQRIEGDWIITLEAFRFYCSEHFYIEVPRFTLTNGPSIPPFLMPLLQRSEIYFSGVAHDYTRGFLKLSYRGIDGIFYDMCYAELEKRNPFVKQLKSIIAYLGVRIGSYLNFSTVPSQDVIEKAKKEVQEELNLPNSSCLCYNKDISVIEVNYNYESDYLRGSL